MLGFHSAAHLTPLLGRPADHSEGAAADCGGALPNIIFTPQITAEVQQLIEATAAAYRDYQATRAEVSRHLEAAQRSTDALAQPQSPLPELPSGPDEVRGCSSRCGVKL